MTPGARLLKTVAPGVRLTPGARLKFWRVLPKKTPIT